MFLSKNIAQHRINDNFHFFAIFMLTFKEFYDILEIIDCGYFQITMARSEDCECSTREQLH